MQELHKYVYEGPVMLFDNCIDPHWYGVTMAPSERKAKNNLTYRYKQMTKRIPGVKIILPGKLQKVE